MFFFWAERRKLIDYVDDFLFARIKWPTKKKKKKTTKQKKKRKQIIMNHQWLIDGLPSQAWKTITNLVNSAKAAAAAAAGCILAWEAAHFGIDS